MAKTPDEIVADIDRKQNKEDRELITKPARAIVEGAKRMYNAATGKNAKDFEPRRYLSQEGYEPPPTGALKPPSYSPGSEIDVRPLNMGKKSKAPTSADFKKYDEDHGVSKGGENLKKGGKVSSASKRADGIATKGKTRGRIC